MKLTFLGTADAAGVPLFGCDCSICLQAKKGIGRRKPCSAMIAFGDKTLLIDAGRADLIELFDQYHFNRILLTHYHTDHVQGLFHIRWGKKGINIPVHGPADHEGCADLLKHPGILDFSDYMQAFQTREFDGLSVIPLALNHSKITLGYCFEYKSKRLAYLTDTMGLPKETASFLIDWHPDVLIVDCSHPPEYENKRNHNDLHNALEIHRLISPEQTWLTHISHTFDTYQVMNGIDLPSNVHIASDGDSLNCNS